jgi:hypothetical protein
MELSQGRDMWWALVSKVKKVRVLHLHIPFFRCVVLTNMCVHVPSNTTVILDGVLSTLGYMFRPLLGHHQAILEVCYFGFHKNAGNFLTSCKDWLASEEGFCSME